MIKMCTSCVLYGMPMELIFPSVPLEEKKNVMVISMVPLRTTKQYLTSAAPVYVYHESV